MSVDPQTLAAILAMAVVTYLTRVGGIALAGRLSLSPRARAAFDAIPPAVLTALIAPDLITGGPAVLMAGGVTILAATRLPFLATVVIGVASVVALRALIG